MNDLQIYQRLRVTFFIWRLFNLSTINKDLVSQGGQAALQTDFVTREYFPSSSGEMWQIVSCHIFWRICDKVPAVVFADGFFLRIPLDWGTMREGQGRAGQSKVTSKIRFLQSRFLCTPWMWFGGMDRQYKALVLRILQQNEESLVFWPTEGHIYHYMY